MNEKKILDVVYLLYSNIHLHVAFHQTIIQNHASNLGLKTSQLKDFFGLTRV